MSADLINAAFEAFSALMVADHCRILLRDRTVRGVSLLAVAFFTAWGGRNLYYYPALGQSLSGACALLVLLANATYLTLALRFRNAERRPYLFWETH